MFICRTQDEMRKKVVRQYKKLVYNIVREMETGCTDISRRYAYNCDYQYFRFCVALYL